MKKIRFFILVGIILFTVTLMVSTLVAVAQTPVDQPVDETLGVPAPDGPIPRGGEVPAGGTLSLLDDFNRADGPIGDAWTVHSGYCNVSSNAAVCGSSGRATFNTAPGDGGFAEADVAVNGTSLQYTGLVLNYGGGVTNLFLKVQEQSPYSGQFTHAACYYGTGTPFGLGFFSLTSFFSTAHMAATRVGNTVTIQFTNVDGGGQPDQTYVCDGAPAPEGTGIGIVGYAGIARLDNFGGPGAAEPDITVDPAELHATLPPDRQETQPLTICNVGEADLTWEIVEIPTVLGGSMPFIPVSVGPSHGTPAGLSLSSGNPAAGIPAGPANPDAVLWDQPLSAVNQGAYIDQEFSDFPTYSSFLADDFVAGDPWSISTIFLPGDGWNGFATLFNATALTWQIYADNAGVPDGDPSGAGNPPLWTLTLAPTDPQVLITNGTPGGLPSNTQLNLTTPIELPPGTYWLVFYPSMDFTYGQYGRQPADTTNGYTGQFVNPGGAFGYGTVWQDWNVLGPTQTDIAFRLEGEINPGYDIPWLSENPLAGRILPGECSMVDVTFDSIGLALGDYFGNLEVNSNDPDEPVVVVPVQLTVVPWITWEKFIDGEPWAPDMTITVQTSDTIVVEEVLHLMGGAPLAAAGPPAQAQAAPALPTLPAESASRVQPQLPTLPDTPHKPLQAAGLLYLTSLETGGDPGDDSFSVYDPLTDAWTTLTAYDTGCRMASSAWGQLYAYGFNTNTIDVYDPATDTWSAVMASPSGSSGQFCNLEITNAGEFLYTQDSSTTLWYTSAGVWNTMTLPFVTNVMGDYDPTSDQYVIGERNTTNAHLIDVHTWAITDYFSSIGNGEYARFSVVMGDRYYFEAGGSNIHYFDLSVPADPPVDTGLNWGWYSSAAGDRLNNVIFNASLDSTALELFDPLANTLSPLTGYGSGGWHSSLTFVAPGAQPAPVFAQIETWDPAHLQLLDWAATGGEVVVVDGQVTWSGEILEPATIVLTKWFHVEPSTWTETLLMEELWLDDTLLEQRPVVINKLPPELWIDAAYEPVVYGGQEVSFTLSYGNSGGFENDVMIRNDFPVEAPFIASTPPPDRVDPDGLWAEWDVGDLPTGAEGSIEVWVAIQTGTPAPNIIQIWGSIFNHVDGLADEVSIDFELLSTVDLAIAKIAPAEVFVGDTFTYTVYVVNNGPDDVADVTIEDTLPVSVTYVSDNLGCSYASGVLTCEIPFMAVDESVALYIVVTANAAGLVTNFAEVWSADLDPNPENNEASADTLISEIIVPDVFYYFVPVVYKN